jgi:hypothetical protein
MMEGCRDMDDWNVIAGLAHDHLFVACDERARALALLQEL